MKDMPTGILQTIFQTVSNQTNLRVKGMIVSGQSYPEQAERHAPKTCPWCKAPTKDLLLPDWTSPRKVCTECGWMEILKRENKPPKGLEKVYILVGGSPPSRTEWVVKERGEDE